MVTILMPIPGYRILKINVKENKYFAKKYPQPRIFLGILGILGS